MSDRTIRKQLTLALATVARAERAGQYRLATNWQRVVNELQEKLSDR